MEASQALEGGSIPLARSRFVDRRRALCSSLFIFGQNDWMDKFGTERLHKRDENKYKYYLIPNTGHRWPIEKVEEGAKIINDNL